MLVRLKLLAAATALLTLSAAGACDSSEGTDAASDTVAAEDTSVADTASEVEDTSVADTAMAEDTVESYPYPDPPYAAPDGTLEQYETIPPELSFYDPWTGETHAMKDYYLNPDVSILLISSAAGWCTACEYEAWDLVDAYDKYHADGLEILYTLYEDTLGKKIWQEGASDEEISDDFTFMNLWRENIGPRVGLEKRKANYPVLVDIGWQLGGYYDKAATPFTIMVRTRDMQVVYEGVGYSAGTIEQHIKNVLYSGL